MRKRSSITQYLCDINELSASIVGETSNDEPTEAPAIPEKNPHAAALGRLGGRKGGPARAASLTAAQRSEIARKAAEARWQRQREEARKNNR
jgi:hypothetical protein